MALGTLSSKLWSNLSTRAGTSLQLLHTSCISLYTIARFLLSALLYSHWPPVLVICSC